LFSAGHFYVEQTADGKQQTARAALSGNEQIMSGIKNHEVNIASAPAVCCLLSAVC
jgi:hypothetical protein